MATVPVELAATAHIESPAAVAVRSRVTGTLEKVHFTEGQEVEAGALLFTIDPRPFAAVLARAEAELARDRAELENSRRELARYTTAAAKGFVSAEQADQAATRVATFSAAVKAGQAAVDAARLELGFAAIRSPLTGRTGEVRVDAGNLVRANDETPLVTIHQMTPVHAACTLPGRHLPLIRQHQAEAPLTARLTDPAGGSAPLTGTLSFIDNTVDPATGAIRLIATFANDDRALWPGQMVDLRLLVTERPDSVVVPARAVQTGQQGPYVFVVKADKTVAVRPVTPGLAFGEELVIDKGLAAGERVVTDGQLLLADGVSVQERTTAGAPARPAANAEKPAGNTP
jgi:multidrug efflux system membrane fusion protein